MTTPLQALDKALREGRNANEVLASLGGQGFAVIHQGDLINAATQVFSYMRDVTNPEATAKTVITASIAGAIMQGMLKDD